MKTRLYIVLFALVFFLLAELQLSASNNIDGVIVDKYGPVANVIVEQKGWKHETSSKGVFHTWFASEEIKDGKATIKISALGHKDWKISLYVGKCYILDIDTRTYTVVEASSPSSIDIEPVIIDMPTSDTPVIDKMNKKGDDGFRWTIRKHESGLISVVNGKKEIIAERLGARWVFYNDGFFSVGFNDESQGLYRNDGSEVLGPKLLGYRLMGPELAPKEAACGFVVVKHGFEDAMLSTDGEILIPFGKYCWISSCPVEIDNGHDISYHYSYVTVSKDYSSYGLYDFNGNEIISPDLGYRGFELRKKSMDEGFIITKNYPSYGVCDMEGNEIISDDLGYSLIVVGYGCISCRMGDRWDEYDYEGHYRRSKGTQPEPDFWDRLSAASAVLRSTGEALAAIRTGENGSSGNNSSSASTASSKTEVYSRDYRNHGSRPAFKVWRGLDGVEVLCSSESVTVTEDNHGSRYMKIGGTYTLLSPNSERTYMGYSVADYNYSAIYQGAHYFVSVR